MVEPMSLLHLVDSHGIHQSPQKLLGCNSIFVGKLAIFHVWIYAKNISYDQKDVLIRDLQNF